jgi:HAD superfamily hydrolase (TIGR01490 family)
MSNVSKIAAIFDVDRTLVRLPTERLFFLFLFWRRIISPPRALRFLKELTFHRQDRYRNKSYLQGLAVPEIETLARDCYQKLIKPRLSRVGQACLLAHQNQGHKIIVLTGSLECLMLSLKKDLAADWLIATQLQTSSNHYTGAIAGLHPRGQNKLRLLLELSQVAGFDLSQSFAYADHLSDLPLLQHVGRPVAVNPSPQLKTFAQAHSWPICRF